MEKSKNYKLLKTIINEEDPLGLVDTDTPESLNEYDPELKEIFKKDIFSLSSEDLSEWIYEVFVSFFNKELAGSKDKYKTMADKFLSNISK